MTLSFLNGGKIRLATFSSLPICVSPLFYSQHNFPPLPIVNYKRLIQSYFIDVCMRRYNHLISITLVQVTLQLANSKNDDMVAIRLNTAYLLRIYNVDGILPVRLLDKLLLEQMLVHHKVMTYFKVKYADDPRIERRSKISINGIHFFLTYHI